MRYCLWELFCKYVVDVRTDASICAGPLSSGNGNGMLSKYQYMLQMPASMAGGDSKLEQMVSMMMFSQAVETENPDAEKFSAYSLNTLPGKYKSEEIILYGVENNSKYINIKWKTSDSASDTDVKNVENIPEIYLSSGYAEKFSLKKGDTITLKEKYRK